MPPEVWGPLGVLVGVTVTGFVSWLRDRHRPKIDAATLALNLAESLREDVSRLSGRVEVLERDRNAYRSWSHVLWSHIHDEQAPRTPAPTWPENLAR